ncbi:25S rRNA (uracil(2634)-N(3))-methyltransferase [Malassezia yamatoensis]|uniref:25S rRNA (Uracil(2634)-N(3))-methyltransferase n=1 Tax=Malassezia yamatoensis TaxID=253288 RepID=A0AAJ5Z1S8_9BASI|nr:25S rRNA (uracil(2634)-N(3))-methyltransferase [Malassezia yamatoensis]
MVKRGKGKLRTALVNHQARSLQRKAEKQHAEAREAALNRKAKSKNSSAKPKPKKHVSPFTRDDTILLIGEGNFSFALSLLCEPHCHPPHLLLATSFDTEQEVHEKYPDARDILTEIRKRAGVYADSILAFGVDAGALHKYTPITGGRTASPYRWSKVWFGFPHANRAGAGHKDEQRNVLANQLLLLRFFVSVAPFLTRGPIPTYAANVKKIRNESDDDDDDDQSDDFHADNGPKQSLQDIQDLDQYDVQEAHTKRAFQPPFRQGSVLITLRNTSPYTLWNVPMLAKRLPKVLAPIVASAPALPRHMHAPTVQDVERNEAYYTLWRSYEFFPEDWSHYSHRRTVGWIEGVSTSENQDLLRRTNATAQLGKHSGTGECRTWEVGLRDS